MPLEPRFPVTAGSTVQPLPTPARAGAFVDCPVAPAALHRHADREFPLRCAATTRSFADEGWACPPTSLSPGLAAACNSQPGPDVSPGGDAAGGGPIAASLSISKGVVPRALRVDDVSAPSTDEASKSPPGQLWAPSSTHFAIPSCATPAFQDELGATPCVQMEEHLQLQDRYLALEYAARIEICELRRRLQEVHCSLADNRAERTIAVAQDVVVGVGTPDDRAALHVLDRAGIKDVKRVGTTQFRQQSRPFVHLLQRLIGSEVRCCLVESFHIWSTRVAFQSRGRQLEARSRSERDQFMNGFACFYETVQRSIERLVMGRIRDRQKRLLSNVFSAWTLQSSMRVVDQKCQDHCMRVVVETELDWRCKLIVCSAWGAWVQFASLEQQARTSWRLSEELHAALNQCRRQNAWNCRSWRIHGARVVACTVQRFQNIDESLRIVFDAWHGVQIEKCRFLFALETERAHALCESSSHRVIAFLRTSHLRSLVLQAFRALADWRHYFHRHHSWSCCDMVPDEVRLREAWTAWRAVVFDCLQKQGVRVIAFLRASHVRSLVLQAFRALAEWCQYFHRHHSWSCCGMVPDEARLWETWAAWRSVVLDSFQRQVVRAQQAGNSRLSRASAVLLQINRCALLFTSFNAFASCHWRFKKLRSNSFSRIDEDKHRCVFDAWIAWRLLMIGGLRAKEQHFSVLARSSLQACRSAIYQSVETKMHAAAVIMSVRCFLKWQEYGANYMRQIRLWQWLRGDRELIRECFAIWLSAVSWRHGHKQACNLHRWLRVTQMLSLARVCSSTGLLLRRRKYLEQCGELMSHCFTVWAGLVSKCTAFRSQHVQASKWYAWSRLSQNIASARVHRFSNLFRARQSRQEQGTELVFRCFVAWHGFATHMIRTARLHCFIGFLLRRQSYVEQCVEPMTHCFLVWSGLVSRCTAFRSQHVQTSKWYAWLRLTLNIASASFHRFSNLLSARRSCREGCIETLSRCFAAWLGFSARCVACKSQHVLEAMRDQYFQWAECVRSNAYVWVCLRMWRITCLGLLVAIGDFTARNVYQNNSLLILSLLFMRWRKFSLRARLFERCSTARPDLPLSWMFGQASVTQALHVFFSWRALWMECRLEQSVARCGRLTSHLMNVQRATEAITLFNQRLVLIAALDLWWESVSHVGFSSPCRGLVRSPCRSPAVSPPKEIMQSFVGTVAEDSASSFSWSALPQHLPRLGNFGDCVDQQEWKPGSLKNSTRALCLEDWNATEQGRGRQ